MIGENISVVPDEVTVLQATDLLQPPQTDPSHLVETTTVYESPTASEAEMAILRRYSHFPLESGMGIHEVDKCPNCMDNGGGSQVH